MFENKNLKAISIDDNRVNLILIESMAKEIGLEVTSFLDPLKALEYAKTNQVDFIFTDYIMPNIDGVALIKELHILHPDVPIIMITSITDDNDLKLSALKAGATEFLNKPLIPAEFKIRVHNLSALRRSQLLLNNKALLLQDEINKSTEMIRKREHEVLNVLGSMTDYKDKETAAHISRVADFSLLIAKMLQLPNSDLDLIYHASPLHDIGKLGVRDEILLKPAKLTASEYAEMKQHAAIGHRILKTSSSPYLQAGGLIAITHHEKYGGGGYPFNLSGNDIHVYGRIVAIADVFDALISKRPYKEAWSIKKALELIESESGKHFDPLATKVFLENIQNIRDIIDRYGIN